MANEKKLSFYEVLGVDKSADERAIKKAYFALVRKYPPETHPEEFKKIREAYEVLSNPQSRKDYDAVDQFDQYGEEIKARLQAATEAMDRADYVTAQKELVEVLRLQPQLHFARDLLGMAYLNNDQADQALAQFEAVITAQPENAVYRLHKGYAHYHKKEYVPAMDAYRAAQKLDEADTRVLVAMADCLSSQRQYEAALAELDKAINMDGTVDFNDFVFFMRKVQIQLLRNRADLAEQDLDQVFKILPDDADVKKYVATRLASLAADLFAMKRSVDANRLLQRCKLLDSSRASMSFQFPAKATLPIKLLPQGSQDWIATHGKEWAAGKLSHNPWVGPVFGLICALLLALGVLGGAFGGDKLWDGGQRVTWFLFLVGAPLLVALGIRRVRRVAKSRFGKYTTIHPLHLMQVDVDKVTIWPLVNLHDVSLTHHSTNGVYQYTAVRMDFAGTICNLTIRGQQASVDWANRVLGQRRRVLELMSMGLLDAEDGFDLVPPEQLGKPAPKADPDVQRQKQVMMRWYGAFAGAGALLAAVAIPYNTGAAERAEWRRCEGSWSTVRDYRRYLDKFPSGKHAGQIKQLIDAKYDSAIDNYRVHASSADPKSVQAMVDVIGALKKSNTRRVKVTYESSVDFSELKSWPKDQTTGIVPADSAFTESANKSRESSITSTLSKSFGDLLTHDVIDFTDGSSSSYDYDYDYDYRHAKVEAASPVTFAVKYKVVPSGSIYESTTGTKKRLFGIRFYWDFSIRFDGESADRYHVATVSSPAKNIRYSTYGYESDDYPYTEMAKSAFEEFGRKLEGGFGVSVAAPSESVQDVLGNLGSGTAGGALGGSGKYGAGGLSPEEMQRLLDAIRKNQKHR